MSDTLGQISRCTTYWVALHVLLAGIANRSGRLIESSINQIPKCIIVRRAHMVWLSYRVFLYTSRAQDSQNSKHRNVDIYLRTIDPLVIEETDNIKI